MSGAYGIHAWSLDSNEFTSANGWVFEGNSIFLAKDPLPGLVPVYRSYNPYSNAKGDYFLALTLQEAQQFQYQGLIGYMATAASSAQYNMPNAVYRFNAVVGGPTFGHMHAIGAEADNLKAMTQRWTLEGVMGYSF